MFINKKILFYGPALTKDKESININNYDIIIITNNMCDNFFKKYNVKPPVLIYLICNQTYCMNYYNTIKTHIDKIDIVLTWSLKAKNFLTDKLKVNKIHILENNSLFNMMNYVPLCLTRILRHLEKYQFNRLHIIGCTFYDNKKPFYEENYQLNTPSDKLHNFSLNLDYLKYFIKNRNNVQMSDELLKKINQINPSNVPIINPMKIINNKKIDSQTLLLIYKNKR